MSCFLQVLAIMWFVCLWPAAISPPVFTRMRTHLETTTWTISHWPLRTSTWRSLSLFSFTYTYPCTSLYPFDLSSSSPQIPLLQRAQVLSPRPLSLLASAWSSPAWMKTNDALIGKGSLKGQPGGKEYKAWAQYYIRWHMWLYLNVLSYGYNARLKGS